MTHHVRAKLERTKSGRTKNKSLGNWPETKTFFHFWPLRTWTFGAEHMGIWWKVIVCAKSDPGDCKAHFIRFLGTYNILNLLVFTVGMAVVAGEGPPRSDAPVDLFVLTLGTLMVGLAGTGSVASTIFYATVSPVSHANFIAFAKRPIIFGFSKFVNDCSIGSVIMVAVTCFAQAYRLCVTSSSDADEALSRWPVLAAVIFSGLLILRLLWFVGIITNTTLYSGLFADTAVTPDGDVQWAHHATPREIEDFISQTAMDETSNRKTHQKDAIRMYRRHSITRKRVTFRGAAAAVRAGNLVESH